MLDTIGLKVGDIVWGNGGHSSFPKGHPFKVRYIGTKIGEWYRLGFEGSTYDNWWCKWVDRERVVEVMRVRR